jgi:hypothetical protein
MVYTHVLNRGPGAVRSPADGLPVSREPETLGNRPRAVPGYTPERRRLSPPRNDASAKQIDESVQDLPRSWD